MTPGSWLILPMLVLAGIAQDPVPPGAFGKSGPANGATAQPPSLTLSWSASSDATAYEYCIDMTNDEACTGGGVISGTSVNLKNLVPGTYYWQVRATNAWGAAHADGSSTAFWSFTSTEPTRPAIDLEGNGTGDVFTYLAGTGTASRRISLLNGGFVFAGQWHWTPDWTVAPMRFSTQPSTGFFLFNTATGAWTKILNDGVNFITQSTGNWWPGWQRYVMDLDADGNSDVFLYDPMTGAWFKCISTGPGFTYEQGYWSPGWEIYPITLNADTLDDMFLINRDTGQWYWALGNPSGFSYPATGWWHPAWAIYPDDFNGDGRTDLFLYDSAAGQHYIAVVTDTGYTYTSGTGWAEGWTPWVVDLNADGLADLFLHNQATGRWVELEGDGAGGFTSVGGGQWATGWDLYPSDVNGDGRWDLFLYDPTSGAWYLARNFVYGSFTYNSGTWQPGLTIITRAPIR